MQITNYNKIGETKRMICRYKVRGDSDNSHINIKETMPIFDRHTLYLLPLSSYTVYLINVTYN